MAAKKGPRAKNRWEKRRGMFKGESKCWDTGLAYLVNYQWIKHRAVTRLGGLQTCKWIERKHLFSSSEAP